MYKMESIKAALQIYKGGGEWENKQAKDMEQIITKQQVYEETALVHYLCFLVFKVVVFCHVFYSRSSVRISVYIPST